VQQHQEEKKNRKKRVAVVLTLTVLASGVSGLAYSYWTTGGSGSGTATTAAGVSDITVVQTSTVSGLAPGLGAQDLEGNFNNPNTSPVHISTVVASLTTDKVGCTEDDYTLVQPGVVNAEIPVGTGVGSWSGGSIAFKNDTARNQDACKGAVVTIAYVAS
jgi:hypothetical protein